MKKKLKKNLILSGIILFLVIAFGLILYFGVLQSVLGVSEALNYKTTFDYNDGEVGIKSVEATLNLPIQTSEFSLTPYYNRYTANDGSGSFAIKYEIFNYQTNSWETFHDKTWVLTTSASRVSTEGGEIYTKGVPMQIVSDKTTATGVYPSITNKYYSCADGKTVEQYIALGLIPTSTDPTRLIWNQYCVYQEGSAVDTGSQNRRYFPPLYTFNTNYISNNQALFRITYNGITSSMSDPDNTAFKIELWKVITNEATVWTYNTTTLICESSSKYTYELTTNDYYSEIDCKIANNITEVEKCSIFNPCGVGYDCIDGVCEEIEEPPIQPPVNEKEINWKKIITWVSISLVVIFIITIILLRKK
jgi:hypothetical protein